MRNSIASGLLRSVKTHAWILLSVAGVLSCAAFSDLAKTPSPEVRAAHKRACQAKGELIIERDAIEGIACSTTDLSLRTLVSTDEDCKAYFGDAGVSVTFSTCPRDGGAE